MEVTPTQLIALLREGTAPLKVRAAIARGTLPLPPATLLEALDILADDPDPAIRAEALAGFERLPATVVRGVVSSRALAPGLLERLAQRYPGSEPVLLDIARNARRHRRQRGVHRHAGGSLRLSRRSAAIRCGSSAHRRSSLPCSRTPQPRRRSSNSGRSTSSAERSRPASSLEEEDDSADGAQTFEPVLVEEDEKAEAETAPPLAAEADAALSAKQLSIFSMLKKMSMGQKVALATKGNREVRNLLIRENNRMLCLKVLENPRLGENDIEAYAKSTNLSDGRPARHREPEGVVQEIPHRQGARLQPEGAARGDARSSSSG